MYSRLSHTGQRRTACLAARSASLRGKSRGIEDNRPSSEAVRALQQKMDERPAPSVLSSVPGYCAGQSSPASSVVQGKGVAQRQIIVGNMSLEEIRSGFDSLLKNKAVKEELKKLGRIGKDVGHIWGIFDQWSRDEKVRSFDSIPELFAKIYTRFPVSINSKRINMDLNYKREDSTHVGFEIETGGHLVFPKLTPEKLATLYELTNETLAVYDMSYHGKLIPVLEVLVDDIKNKGQRAIAQVEYRTKPLDIDMIGNPLKIACSNAIGTFDFGMLKTKGDHEAGKGVWRVPKAFDLFGKCSLEGGRLPVSFAQHATLSIEPEAFAEMAFKHQKVLVPYLAGCKNRQKLFAKMVKAVSKHVCTIDKRSVINANTGGRSSMGREFVTSASDEGACFKTPLEVILAADTSLDWSGIQQSGMPEQVTVEGKKDTYDLGDLYDTVGDIVHARKFPKIQGENELGSGNILEPPARRIGYRIIAEKLQPLFIDMQSGIPRILIEHRGGSFVNAINNALDGKPDSNLESIKKAIKEMDEKRGHLGEEEQTDLENRVLARERGVGIYDLFKPEELLLMRLRIADACYKCWDIIKGRGGVVHGSGDPREEVKRRKK